MCCYHKGFFYEKRPTVEEKKPLPETQQVRAQGLVQQKIFQQRFGSNFYIAMGGATDPIKPPHPFFYSFELF